jgi:hypothetical protein
MPPASFVSLVRDKQSPLSQTRDADAFELAVGNAALRD